MKRILIFGGTSEARELEKRLSCKNFEITMSVATEYGEEQMAEHGENTTVLKGRLNRAQMVRLLAEGGFSVVLDATHPFAYEATENISFAAKATKTPYYRLIRESREPGGAIYVRDASEAASVLNTLEGRVLMTTGSKELPFFGGVSDVKDRLFPRVLPTEEAIKACRGIGIESSHIIAMQGPFSLEMNEAIIRSYGIKILVTKECGVAGGFFEKLEAAKNCGLTLIIIRRPTDETGFALDELTNIILSTAEAEK